MPLSLQSLMFTRHLYLCPKARMTMVTIARLVHLLDYFNPTILLENSRSKAEALRQVYQELLS